METNYPALSRMVLYFDRLTKSQGRFDCAVVQSATVFSAIQIRPPRTENAGDLGRKREGKGGEEEKEREKKEDSFIKVPSVNRKWDMKSV